VEEVLGELLLSREDLVVGEEREERLGDDVRDLPLLER
jgi:hypothetical protein